MAWLSREEMAMPIYATQGAATGGARQTKLAAWLPVPSPWPRLAWRRSASASPSGRAEGAPENSSHHLRRKKNVQFRNAFSDRKQTLMGALWLSPKVLP